LEAARHEPGPVLVHIETDPLVPAPGSEAWWDVPVAEVSELEPTRRARKAYEAAKADQRPVLAPPPRPEAPPAGRRRARPGRGRAGWRAGRFSPGPAGGERVAGGTVQVLAELDRAAGVVVGDALHGQQRGAAGLAQRAGLGGRGVLGAHALGGRGHPDAGR